MSNKLRRGWLLASIIFTLVVTALHLPNPKSSRFSGVSNNHLEARISQLISFERISFYPKAFGGYLIGKRQFLPFYYYAFWGTGVKAPECNEEQLSPFAEAYAVNQCKKDRPNAAAGHCDDLKNHEETQWGLMGCAVEDLRVSQGEGNVFNVANLLICMSVLFTVLTMLPIICKKLYFWVKLGQKRG